MSIDRFADEIKKTGFELEYRMAECFRTHGWTVIANKYYVDDVQEAVREIDLVAYKTGKVQHFRVVTTVIVSCKKTERDAWVLLAKSLDPSDPNIDWQPLHSWSSDRALQHMISAPEWPAEFISHAQENQCGELNEIPKRHIFAFQEMNKTTAKANNDKNIFAAVTSLMKAQAYEIGALPLRLKRPAVYQFNLMSIVETELVRLEFDTTGGITALPTEEEAYVARYIIEKRQTFSRIHFLRSGHLDRALTTYDRLHQSNLSFFAGACDRFYEDAAKVSAKREVFLKDVQEDLHWRFSWRVNDREGNNVAPDAIALSWEAGSGEVVARLPIPGDAIASLNADSSLRQSLASILKKYYRFEGPSRFDDDIPF